MLTTTQKKTAQAIVNIFETGSVLGDYGNVTVIRGDTGHLTFGRSQTTLGSGNLLKLLQSYCDNPGARFAAKLSPYLARFADGDLTLDWRRILAPTCGPQLIGWRPCSDWLIRITGDYP